MVPPGIQPFVLDTNFDCRFLFEKIESNAQDDGKVLSAIVFTYPGLILSESDVKYPMQTILNRPVGTYHLKLFLGRCREGSEIVSNLS